MAEVRLKRVEKRKAKKRVTKKREAAKASSETVQPVIWTEDAFLEMAARRKAERPKPVREPGVERLKKAADRVLGRNCAKLATLLLEKAQEGKLEGVRMLIKLAESKKPTKEPRKLWNGQTLLEVLDSEPKWVDEPEVDLSDLDEEKKAGVEAGGQMSEAASEPVSDAAVT